MRHIDFKDVELKSGFWKTKQEMVSKTTIYSVYSRFIDTGRIDAFKFDWQEGKENKPHIFWDSDVAKWIEGASYILAKKKNKKLEKYIDAIVEQIEKNQCDDGYFNIYYTIVEPEMRFQFRHMHELYCAGHLIEAAIAYYGATKKRKFLDLMIRYADYIYLRFYVKRDCGFTTPGHEEIELALVKLYKVTNDEKYLTLAKYFIDERGGPNDIKEEKYDGVCNQSHLPVVEQEEAVGHSVRAMYLYSGMADVAYLTGDEDLKNACKRLFDDVTTKKMYITGGIGSSGCGEAFTVSYDLPNLVSYTETCAAIGLVLFAHRMMLLDFDSKYEDVIERVIYNGFLSSTSLDGKSFFYENPLEIIPYLSERDNKNNNGWRSIHFPAKSRSEIFSCSCCPPNIVRLIPSIANYLYSCEGDTIFVHQFMHSSATIDLNGKTVKILQKTSYPNNGKVELTVEGGDCAVAVRVPYWCEKAFETKKGYVYYRVKDGEPLSIDFGMPISFIESNRRVILNCRKYALMRGPVVYCLEGIDNPKPLRDILVDTKSRVRVEKDDLMLLPKLKCKGYIRKMNDDSSLYVKKQSVDEKTDITFIPYYAFANRGEEEMLVWFQIKQ